jgi:hypothetical protein
LNHKSMIFQMEPQKRIDNRIKKKDNRINKYLKLKQKKWQIISIHFHTVLKYRN